MQEIDMCEIDSVSGGVVPLAMYAAYLAAAGTGVSAGWIFGRALFCDK